MVQRTIRRFAWIYTSAIQIRQRLLALFLFVIFSATSCIAPAVVSALASSQASSVAMKTNYAGPLSVKPIVPAVDTQNRNALGQQAVQGTPLSGPMTKPKITPHELTDKRTATSDVSQNADGTFTQRNYMTPKYYKVNNAWQDIDSSLIEDKNAGDAGNIFGQAWGQLESVFKPQTTFIVKANDWKARFAPSDFSRGMVRIQQGNEQIGYIPIGANAVDPVVTTDRDGRQTVHYYNVWPNIDLEYQVDTYQVKENIILKNKAAVSSMQFKVLGATLSPVDADGQTAFLIKDALGGQFSIPALNLILNNFGMETNTKVTELTQSFNNGILTVSLSADYLKNLPTQAFPAVIDPNHTFTGYIGNRSSGNYVSFKSDGYVCPSNICNPQAGSLQDSNYAWRSWRGAFYAPYSGLSGKVLLNANLHIVRRTGVSFYTGDSSGHWFNFWHASCTNNFGCFDGSISPVAAWFGDGANVDVTSIYQTLINRGDWGGWLGVTGEEVAANTYKNFDPDPNVGTYVVFTYNTVPPTPTVVSPQVDNQVYVDSQVSVQVAPSTPDFDGDPIQYYFRVATGSDGESGTVINSGNVTSNQWMVPDGVLQDGMTYYLHVYTFDGYNYSTPSAVRPFKIDLRRGRDKTQTYDTAGPVSVDLATGNVTATASSHTSAALGGSLGISLDYNSPLRSRNGLVGEYWNVAANYPGGAPSTPANLVRVDKNIDFNWNQDSPQAGTINPDWFYTRWTGYFVAPTTGSYTFGGSNDDSMSIWINGQQTYGQGCYSGACYGSSVSLSAGQVVPFRVEFLEAVGAAYAHLYVKGAVAEQSVPQSWLQTGPRAIAPRNGLIGNYYVDDGTHNLDSTSKRLFLSRTDPLMSFNWGYLSPVPGGSVDFMARWTGFITIPAGGTYQFGTNADDHARIKINGNIVTDNWTNACCSLQYGGNVSLAAGTYPITIDYYDAGGPGSLYLYEKLSTDQSGQIIPPSWLSPSASLLPDGWDIGIDPDGNVNYDHLIASQNAVVLTDSSGDTHQYAWTGSGYKPPVNEDGNLVRNTDGTYTLNDTDGRIYVFDAAGTLTSVTNPVDDRHPAAIQYQYGGTPAHIIKISDGVDPSRNAQVYYSGDVNCGTPPSGFESTPAGMLCAVKTNDGHATYFYYTQYQDASNISRDVLSRIVMPGDQTTGYPTTDYQYDQLGRIVGIRDSLANDAIAAGIRANDTSTITQIQYDVLGRASGVTLPAATAGAVQQQQTFNYATYSTPLNRYYSGAMNDNATTAANTSSTYAYQWNVGYLLMNPEPGTAAVYSCHLGNDEFTSLDANCEGQQKYGFIGYIYTSPPAGISYAPLYRCTISANGDHFDSNTSNCEGQHVEFLIGYVPNNNAPIGIANEHVVGATEPNGFSRRVKYDTLFRTVADTDKANLTTMSEWDPAKDLLLSTTDATGLKSTTIYDADDRPVSQYGPAPSAWFGSDRTPLSQYAAQVPHSSVAYDEGIVGPAVAWYDYSRPAGSSAGTLFGAPRLHTTGVNPATPGVLSADLTQSPITASTGMQGIGFSATGKLRLPNGTYWINADTSEGIRIWVNDKLVLDSWIDSAYRSITGGSFTVTNASPIRVRIDTYRKVGSTGAFNVWMKQDYGFNWTNNWSQYLAPDYSLNTSSTTYDSQLGNATSTTNYGSNPELGLAQSVSVDPTGLNLTATAGYEAPGSGGFLRQTSKTLPGGVTTNYAYYGATDTVDNPCTQTTEAYREGGMLRLRTEPNPDGAGPQTGRTTETIYDDAGRPVASRYNQDPWTCTTYDARGRVSQQIVPDINGRPGRTITTDYAYQGSPLKVQTTDSVTGTTVSEIDLLGRSVSATDTFGNVSTAAYDTFGRLTTKTSPLGTEAYTYDNLDRPVTYSVNNVTYATITYDAYSQVQSVVYNQAKDASNNTLKLEQIKRDALLRTVGATFRFSNSLAFDETLTRSQGGIVTSSVDAYNSLSATSSYSYDHVGRLTSATIDKNQYTYGYQAPDANVCNQAGANLNAQKDSNRTSFTQTDLTTNQVVASNTYCYDQADRLIASSDTQVGTPTYDDHGNTVSLAGNGTPVTFGYDATDSNTSITQGTNQVTYLKTASGSVLRKKEYQNGSLTASYRYLAGGSVMQTCSLADDTACTTADTYLSLPGGLTLTLSPANPIQAKQTVYSLKNFHGDTAMTVGSDGNPTSSVYLYEPFGQSSSSATFGTNSNPANSTNQSMGWAANPTRKVEGLFTVAIIQMGARVYLPSLGRFLQVDPVEGGTANSYVYVGDPINANDYTGQFGWGDIVHAVRIVMARVTAVLARVAVVVHPAPAARPVAKPAAKTIVNSSVSQQQKVDANYFINLSQEDRRQHANLYAPPSGGYVNFGAQAGFVVTSGAGKILADNKTYDYAGGGVSLPIGLGASVTAGGKQSTGCSTSVSVFLLFVGGSYNLTDGSIEIGLGTPGVSVMYTCVW